MKREVKEEAGLDFEPNALVQVESYEKMSWIRFTFSGMFITHTHTHTHTHAHTHTHRKDVEIYSSYD